MEASILSKQIENAQKKVEEQNFVMRKNVLKYDDVMNRHRSRIYEQRRQVLEGADLSGQVRDWIDEVIERAVHVFTEAEYAEEWDLHALAREMEKLYGTDITVEELAEDGVDLTSREALIEEFTEDAQEAYKVKEEELGSELMRELERFVVLQVVDNRWREHLENMDYLREGVHLRAMAQKDPLVEYTGEGERMFEELGAAIRAETILHLFHAELAPEQGEQALEQAQAADGRGNGNVSYQHETLAGAGAIAAAGMGEAAMQAVPSAGGVVQTVVSSEQEKIGRNDPCWCGSGKKFKRCHGA
jgi:preprotein translocase subunit SecA